MTEYIYVQQMQIANTLINQSIKTKKQSKPEYTSKKQPTWIEAIGNNLIASVEITIGGVVVDNYSALNVSDKKIQNGFKPVSCFNQWSRCSQNSSTRNTESLSDILHNTTIKRQCSLTTNDNKNTNYNPPNNQINNFKWEYHSLKDVDPYLLGEDDFYLLKETTINDKMDKLD